MTSFRKPSEVLKQGAMTLPGYFYTSEEVFQAELERIFYQSWLCIGREEQVRRPREYFLQPVGQESVIVLRNKSGQINAFYNVCRHRGTRMVTQEHGRFSSCVQCPYHAWTYNLDGELIGAPLMDEVDWFDKADYPLQRVAVARWEGFLFINLSRSPEPFETAFAPLIGKFSAWSLPDLRVIRRIEYDVAANWKLVVQNYSECYHCPLIHPDLVRLSPYRSGRNDLYEGPFLGGYMELNHGSGSMTMSGLACAVPLSGVSPEDQERVYYYSIFPNTLLSLHPDYVMVHTLWPLSPGRTKIICEWLFHPEAMKQPDFNPNDAIDFWDMTNRQDWHVCELSQLGVSSRAYIPSPYSGQEALLAAFDRELLKALGREA